MIYLASPYSHPDPLVRERRYQDTLRASAQLIIHNNMTVFSPIVYGHQMSVELDAPTDAKSWASFNNAIMRKCDSMIILCLSGWEESVGVQYELQFARDLRLQVEYRDKFCSVLAGLGQ